MDEDVEHLMQIFTLFQQAGLAVKLKKCSFGHTEIKYLDFKLTEEGVRVDNSKTEAEQAVPLLRNAKEVARFLGMTSWYQHYIPNFAELAEPLYELKRKREKFVSISETQESYKKWKQELTRALVDPIPVEDVDIELFTDASLIGLGATLNQGVKAIANALWTLNWAELN